MVKAEYPQPTVDVRHILFMTVDSSSGEALSEDEVKEKKAKADEVLAQWEALEDKTEEAFGNLADENSEDTGSNTNGGLYENVTPGMMVDSFDKWIFDKSRKEGDVEMIESEYGYHIMYYVGNPNYAYRNTIRTENTQNDYSSWLEEELGKDSSKVTENAAGLEKGYKRAAQRIETTVQYLQQNASTSAAG
ncbi:MAG: peptidyl-prolyl cis-trans isomerase [Clostridia bacterium]|nr:peptidyl-prolyl cis-trans isomerase [Clostridia bacterium]